MSIHFHQLRIKEVRKETNDCVSVSFEVPAEKQKDFQFKQGQSLTVRAKLNGEEVRRTYSLCSSPLDKEWRVAIKKVENGAFSSYANEQLKKGDILEVMSPVGKFNCELDPKNQKQYMAFAAGSGITPVLSIIKTTLALEPHSEFTLVYGNRSRPSILFFEELEALKNKYMDRFNLVHILSRERTDSSINYGRIDTHKLKELNNALNFSSMDEFFICGPEEMIFSVKEFLEENDTDKKKIHFELFTAPGEAFKKLKPEMGNNKTSGANSHITVKLDGRSFEFDLPLNSDTSLLDAALQQGADLPYACKGGMCCTCKAKLVEGEVAMDVHWGLEDEEVEKGYILTCQSHPKTERVIVDFDAK
ncbi:MAG: phenylacetate-CoA oxygenase/reductase subunit PaaK [Chitinophagaceae bacterium]|nr:phenylacetate-CoA oxygenase/reductase subunit PaaK [Chitinophagaceae bacterium]